MVNLLIGYKGIGYKRGGYIKRVGSKKISGAAGGKDKVGKGEQKKENKRFRRL